MKIGFTMLEKNLHYYFKLPVERPAEEERHAYFEVGMSHDRLWLWSYGNIHQALMVVIEKA